MKAASLALCAATFLTIAGVLLSDFLPVLFGAYADQRFSLVSISGFLVVGSVLFLSIVIPVRVRPLTFSLMPVLLVAFSFLGLALPFSGQTFLWVEPGMYAFYFLAVGLTGLCLSASGAASRYAGFLVLGVAGGCFLYGAISLIVYLFALSDGVVHLANFIPWGFANIRYWSHIASWFIPLLPLAVLFGPLKQHRLWRFAVALAAGIWWWIIFLSSARGAALGIVFGAVFAVVVFGRAALPWLKVLLQYLAFGAVIWLILSVLIPLWLFDETQIRELKTDSSGRMPLFIEAWRMSLGNFPFGMGPQSWLTHEAVTDVYSAGRKFGHPHNMYLMWAAEYGWILLVVLAVWIGQTIRSLWKQRAAIRLGAGGDFALLLAGFVASVAAALFHAGVSAVFMAPGSMLIGLFVLIAFFGLVQPSVAKIPHPGKSTNGVRRHAWALMVIAVVSFAWIAWAREVWQYHQAMIEDQAYYQEHALGGTMPRFWFHGNFPRHPSQM